MLTGSLVKTLWLKAGDKVRMELNGLGVVEAGALADLIVVDGDPVADIRILRGPARIRMVIQDGKIVAGHPSAPVLTPA